MMTVPPAPSLSDQVDRQTSVLSTYVYADFRRLRWEVLPLRPRMSGGKASHVHTAVQILQLLVQVPSLTTGHA